MLVNITPAATASQRSERQQTLSVSELSHVQSAGRGEKKVIAITHTIIMHYNVNFTFHLCCCM